MNQSISNRNPTWEPYDKKMDDMAVEETIMKKTQKGFNSTIRGKSDKQAVKDAEWARVTEERCEELDFRCQYCGKPGQRDDPNNHYTWLDGHHLVKRRYNQHGKDVCYPVHRLPCHFEIEDKNIVVEIGDWKLRQYFL